MANIISCRVGVFASAEAAFERFAAAGVAYAEVAPPADGDYKGLAAKATRSGVTIATVATQLDLETDEKTQGFRSVIDGAASIGVRRIFASAKAGPGVPPAVALGRLRTTAEYAHARSVIVCMETHPPFGTNGTVAHATLQAVNHPGLRFNFDTANIYYYNEGTDAVSELRKVLEYVEAVHLKETDGGFKSGNFPRLGQGVVDFPTVFRLLGARGFTGPYTMELEGSIIGKLTPDDRLAFLKDCVAYLRQIGAMA